MRVCRAKLSRRGLIRCTRPRRVAVAARVRSGVPGKTLLAFRLNVRCDWHKLGIGDPELIHEFLVRSDTVPTVSVGGRITLRVPNKTLSPERTILTGDN
jgi:hypothetical protein